MSERLVSALRDLLTVVDDMAAEFYGEDGSHFTPQERAAIAAARAALGEQPDDDRHVAIPQSGSNVCVCGLLVGDETAHLAGDGSERGDST